MSTQRRVIIGVIILLILCAGAAWYWQSYITGSVKGVMSNTTWEFTGTTWKANGTAPTCPTGTLLRSPVDVSTVESMLYPGQVRGGDYKPHGGFRFKNTTKKVTVRAPMDASLTRASRYIEIGEVQYLLEFVNPCGIMYRFDHVYTLSPAMAQAVSSLPQPKKDDSRTTFINPAVSVKAGDIIATVVGFPKSKNIGFDWGVYDLRTKNAASKNAAWAASHGAELAQHGVCWFTLVAPSDTKKIKALPAAGGKTSDYCK